MYSIIYNYCNNHASQKTLYLFQKNNASQDAFSKSKRFILHHMMQDFFTVSRYIFNFRYNVLRLIPNSLAASF